MVRRTHEPADIDDICFRPDIYCNAAPQKNQYAAQYPEGAADRCLTVRLRIRIAQEFIDQTDDVVRIVLRDHPVIASVQ